MLVWLILGLLALWGVVALLRWAAYAEPQQIRRLIFGAGAGLLVIVAVVLLATGRILPSLPFLGGALALWSRLQRARAFWSMFERMRGSAGRAEAGEAPRARSAGMSREEALEILGLGPDPSADEVRQAHRRLIKGLHPDQGGSGHLAAQVNQAKEVLLRGQR